jgi:hypothetical protein
MDMKTNKFVVLAVYDQNACVLKQEVYTHIEGYTDVDTVLIFLEAYDKELHDHINKEWHISKLTLGTLQELISDDYLVSVIKM